MIRVDSRFQSASNCSAHCVRRLLSLAGTLYGWNQQGHEHCSNRDDHKQFDDGNWRRLVMCVSSVRHEKKHPEDGRI